MHKSLNWMQAQTIKIGGTNWGIFVQKLLNQEHRLGNPCQRMINLRTQIKQSMCSDY